MATSLLPTTTDRSAVPAGVLGTGPQPARERDLAAGSRFARLARRIDAATPAHRDRLVDAIRVLAMLVVAFGHWLVADVTVRADGTVQAQDVLAAVPWTQALTLLLQVMGLFFAVSGFSSAVSLAKGHTSGWAAGRISKLLAPTAVYVAVWSVLVLVLPFAVGEDVTRLAGRAVAVHLWFVAVVSLLFWLTPALYAAWTRFGARLPVALVVTSLTVDVLHRVVELPYVGWSNFAFVWATAVVTGFAWQDGTLAARGRRVTLFVGGVVATALLIATPWVPLAMVGVGDAGAATSNNFPPSTVLSTLMAAHLGAVLLLEGPLRRLLARPRVWASVVLAGRVGITVYLWHLTALVLGVVVAMLAGGTEWVGAAGSATWWLTRPLWVGLLLVLLVPLVALLRRTESMRTRVAAGLSSPGPARTALAVALIAWGVARLALLGFAGHGVESVAVLAACVLLGAVPARRASSR